MNTTNKQDPIDPGVDVTDCSLLAIGSSGPWVINVDEMEGEPSRYFAQVEGPTLYVYFELDSLAVLGQLSQFFVGDHLNGETNVTVPPNTSDSLPLGRFESSSVVMRRDDEFGDRFFLVVGATSPSIHFTLAGADVEHVKKALSKVMADLKSDQHSNQEVMP